MRSAAGLIRAFQAAARPGWRGRCVASLMRGALRLFAPRRERIDSNLRLVYPGRDAAWRENFRRQVYDNLAWTVTEVLALQRDARQALEWVREAEDYPPPDGLFAGGALLLSGHFGNWELLGSWYAQIVRERMGTPLYAIYQEIHDRDISKVIREFRERSGIVSLPKDISTLDIVRLLRRGAHVAILADVSWLGGVVLPFMGRPCTNSSGPAVLSMLSSVPIIPVGLYRSAPFQHVVRFLSPLAIPKEGDRRARAERLSLEVNRALERIIAPRPELWFWLHNRWKL